MKSIMEKNHLAADMIDRITIHSTTVTYNHTNWEYKPEGVTAAQMNMPYVVAVTALEGELFIDQFTEEKVKDPEIIAFSRKVEVIPDPELDKLGPQFRHAIVAEMKTVDGRVFSERVDTAKGSNKRPMSADEVIKKFKVLACKVLPENTVDELYDAVLNLEKVSDVRTVAELLTAGGQQFGR